MNPQIQADRRCLLWEHSGLKLDIAALPKCAQWQTFTSEHAISPSGQTTQGICRQIGADPSMPLLNGRRLVFIGSVSARSTTEIAGEVGLSQAPCWRRIQRLKEAGYIVAQVSLLDQKKLGFNAQVFAQVKLMKHGRSDIAKFSDAIPADRD
jgi:hypothetical protein